MVAAVGLVFAVMLGGMVARAIQRAHRAATGSGARVVVIAVRAGARLAFAGFVGVVSITLPTILSWSGSVQAVVAVAGCAVALTLVVPLAPVVGALRSWARAAEVYHSYGGGIAASRVDAADLGLTQREVELVRHVQAGLIRTRDLAEALAVSRSTVDSHVRSLLRKMGAHSRTQLVFIDLTSGDAEVDLR